MGADVSVCGCVCVGVYLCLEGQPCQPIWQQGTESNPALVELLRCLGNVISTTPLWRSRQNNKGGVTQSNAHWYILQNSQTHHISPCRGQINTYFTPTNSAQCYWRWGESQEVNSNVSLSNFPSTSFLVIDIFLRQMAILMCKTPVLERKNLNEVPGAGKRKINAKVVQRWIYAPVWKRANKIPSAVWQLHLKEQNPSWLSHQACIHSPDCFYFR